MSEIAKTIPVVVNAMISRQRHRKGRRRTHGGIETKPITLIFNCSDDGSGQVDHNELHKLVIDHVDEFYGGWLLGGWAVAPKIGPPPDYDPGLDMDFGATVRSGDGAGGIKEGPQ